MFYIWNAYVNIFTHLYGTNVNQSLEHYLEEMLTPILKNRDQKWRVQYKSVNTYPGNGVLYKKSLLNFLKNILVNYLYLNGIQNKFLMQVINLFHNNEISLKHSIMQHVKYFFLSPQEHSPPNRFSKQVKMLMVPKLRLTLSRIIIQLWILTLHLMQILWAFCNTFLSICAGIHSYV